MLEYFEVSQQNEMMGSLHGKALETEASFGEVTILPMYHPAAAFYNKDIEDTLRQDFQVLKQFA
jgi:uracil-DNA glycosylase